MRLNKRGLEMGTIIGIGFALIGFAIVLYFVYQTYWTERIDKETCHQSIVYRASALTTGKVAEYIPLKCKTDKICITAGLFGGGCPTFKGLDGITTMRVKNKAQIEKIIAENIIDCWKIMGEGKLSLFDETIAQKYGVGSVYPTCMICNRIALNADRLIKAGIDLADINPGEYMRTHALPDSEISYSDYFGGEGGKMSTERLSVLVPGVADVVEGEGENQKTRQVLTPSGAGDSVEVRAMTPEEIAAQDKEIYSKDIAIMFMQISSPKHGESAINVAKLAGKTVAAAYEVTDAKTVIKGGKLIAKACTCCGPWGPIVCGAIVVIAGVYQQGNIAVQRGYTAGLCGDITAGSEARDGCSAVRTTNYDMDSITKYCAIIESMS